MLHSQKIFFKAVFTVQYAGEKWNLPQTVNEIFLYSTVSTLKPIVGIVVTISPEMRELYHVVESL